MINSLLTLAGLRRVSAALALSTLLAACGGGDSGHDTPGEPCPPEQPTPPTDPDTPRPELRCAP